MAAKYKLAGNRRIFLVRNTSRDSVFPTTPIMNIMGVIYVKNVCPVVLITVAPLNVKLKLLSEQFGSLKSDPFKLQAGIVVRFP